MKLIQEGDRVLIRSSLGNNYFETVKSNGSVRIKKIQYSLKPLIGQPWFSHFELDKAHKTLKLMKETPEELLKIEEMGASEDNRNLIDDGQAQTLTQVCIQKNVDKY